MDTNGRRRPGPEGKPVPGDSNASQPSYAEIAEIKAVLESMQAKGYSEQSNSDSDRGLDKFVLQPYHPDWQDARSRGRLIILATSLLGAIVILGAVLLVTDSILGKNPSALIDYLKYTINLVQAVVLLALGYFFGSRGKKAKN